MIPHFAALENFTECDEDTLDMVIDASAQLGEEVLAPLNGAADAEGCTR